MVSPALQGAGSLAIGSDDRQPVSLGLDVGYAIMCFSMNLNLFQFHFPWYLTYNDTKFKDLVNAKIVSYVSCFHVWVVAGGSCQYYDWPVLCHPGSQVDIRLLPIYTLSSSTHKLLYYTNREMPPPKGISLQALSKILASDTDQEIRDSKTLQRLKEPATGPTTDVRRSRWLQLTLVINIPDISIYSLQAYPSRSPHTKRYFLSINSPIRIFIPFFGLVTYIGMLI